MKPLIDSSAFATGLCITFAWIALMCVIGLMADAWTKKNRRK